ncbi:MAG TPA: hypothetical protein VGR89_08175, partial [Puia sp.]|nr:hypothetical protein [Puia sp.]
GFRTFYASSGDLPSSRTNRIHELLPDNKGRIWGSTTDGIFYFDTHTQRLIPWQPPGSDSGNREAFSRSYHIFLDSSQSPWLTTFATITPRSDHLLWAGRGNMVYQLDAITHDTLRTWQGPANLVIQDIHFDHYDRCWISTWGNGIYLFDPKTNSWQPFAPSDKRSVVRGGADWRFDGQWYMVFACSTPALLLVNEKDLSFYAVPFDYSPLQFMQGPFVDRQNILWLTTSDGVYYSTSSSNLFEVFNIPVLPSKVEKPSFAYVYCMKEDSTGYWLSKRYYGGIFWYDRQWRLRRVWQGTKVLVPGRFGAPGATSGEAFDFQRVGHDMFISTESGLSVLNLDHFTWTILKPADAINPRLRTILVDNPHAWWIRSFNQGVYVFDPIARKFTHHYVIIDTSRNGQTWILHSLVEDKQRRIFASANTGLFQYNPSTDRFEPVALKGVAVPSRELFGLATDSSGMLLIGGENGLFVYNPLTHAIERTLKEDNKIGVVSRVCTDTRQNVWLSSVSGYWCWLRRQDKVIHFDYSLGLPTTDDGAMYRTTDGTVYAGAKDAVIRFFPRRIMEYRSTAGAKIVDAVVNDSIAAFRFNSDGSRELNLPPDRSSFSVDFDIINYD